MLKKLFKLSLLLLMCFGCFIAVSNFMAEDLHSGTIKKVTWYKDIPDCKGLPLDCHDATGTKTE